MGFYDRVRRGGRLKRRYAYGWPNPTRKGPGRGVYTSGWPGSEQGVPFQPEPQPVVQNNAAWTAAGVNPIRDFRFKETWSVKDFVSDTTDKIIYTAGEPFLGQHGLTVCPVRDNFFTYSEQLEHANWHSSYSTNKSTVQANNHIAPDGTATADTVNHTPDWQGLSRLMQTWYSVPDKVYTISGYFKRKGDTKFTKLYLDVEGNNATQVNKWGAGNAYPSVTYNWNTGALTNSGPGVTSTVTDAGNGWKRISCSCLRSSQWITYHIGGIEQLLDHGDLHVWGMQLEEGLGTFRYIKTAASSVKWNGCAAHVLKSGTVTVVSDTDAPVTIQTDRVVLNTNSTWGRLLIFPGTLSGATITAIKATFT